MPNDPEQTRRDLDMMEKQILELQQQLGKSAPDTGESRGERRLDVAGTNDRGASEKLQALQHSVQNMRADLSRSLTPWQRVKLARHPQRPYFLDYVANIFEGFSEIHGDRAFADDAAIVCGMARLGAREVLVVGQQKGRNTKENLLRNFGMSRPEGYRKAIRAMQFAAKFRRPVFTFLDTPGAYPGLDAEQRGQAEAIAHNLREMASLPVPVIVTIVGEGGSGGALGLGVGDRILILENSVYSVISPEGCASILWRDSAQAELAAAAMKVTAQDLLQLKLVDEIVPEPPGGAQFDARAAAMLLKPVLERNLGELEKLSPEQLVVGRYEKFRRMGQFFEATPAGV